MQEFYDGRLRLRNTQAKLDVMLVNDDGLPLVIMKLDRNRDEVLGFLRLMKTIENTPKETIQFIRAVLYDIKHYNHLKFNKRNPKELLIDAELVDMSVLVEEYKKSLEEEE